MCAANIDVKYSEEPGIDLQSAVAFKIAAKLPTKPSAREVASRLVARLNDDPEIIRLTGGNVWC